MTSPKSHCSSGRAIPSANCFLLSFSYPEHGTEALQAAGQGPAPGPLSSCWPQAQGEIPDGRAWASAKSAEAQKSGQGRAAAHGSWHIPSARG